MTNTPTRDHAWGVAYYPVPANPYDGYLDLAQIYSEEQRAQLGQHTLTRFPTWLAVVLHFLTCSLFSLIYQGLKFSKLPEVKADDFKAGKAIGFMFIPLFNLYWQFRFWLGLADRLNFQFRLRGKPHPIPRGLVLTMCIVAVIPYVSSLAFLIFQPIVVGFVQSATNKLANETVS